MAENKIEIIRHSTAHLIAAAVLELFPNAKFGVGPTVENGFYYDFDLPRSLTPEDLPKIDKMARQILKKNIKFVCQELDINEAIGLFQKADQPYKIELLNDIKKFGTTDVNKQTEIKELSNNKVSIYTLGRFVDLCRGPHISSTQSLGAFKLTKIAGAYWRGDEKNKMLQRIYGVAFENQQELSDYLKLQEEAEKRDHRKLGKELDLFSIDDYVGPGLVLWHPKLSIVREQIELYWRREHYQRGYQYVYTPHIGLSNLWQTSGHLENFQEGMYPPMLMAEKDEIEKTKYYVKPMSCPFHVRIYKSQLRSYRDLPLRFCELGSVYRFERSGVLHGMLRVRGFTQDDAHVFCREDQFVDEINKIIDFALDINKVFGFDKLNVYLSVRDPKITDKYIQNEHIWKFAEKILEEILVKRKIKFQKDIGGAKFYGPAVDMKAVDSLGREWQGTTIQLDMNLPSRFQMTYIDKDGKEKTPIMLHHTVLGSMERFVGTLIEHYAGAFPVWLSPVQVKLVLVNEKHIEFVQKLASEFKKENIRVELDISNETVGNKIRKAANEKVPYMLVIGDKEAVSDKLIIRDRGSKDTREISKEEFFKEIKEKINSKK
ncbi:MAG: threonine--tRNA ligase [Patescibacteria group bacterium]|nr:threonine--tRNA ligase [Patescibacteria group bacterium]